MVISALMYVLWTLTIIAVLSATFTNFQYPDLDLIAGVLLVFSIINSLFAVSQAKKK